MSAPCGARHRGDDFGVSWVAKPLNSDGVPQRDSERAAWGHVARGGDEGPRAVVIGTFALNVVLMLIVLAGLGVIMKGCTEFGSPFVAERRDGGWAR